MKISDFRLLFAVSLFENDVLFCLLPLPIVFAPDKFSSKFGKHMQIQFFSLSRETDKDLRAAGTKSLPRMGST